MENIYKWISILAKSTTPEGIMKIVPLRKQYLFVMHTSKTRRQDLIKSKHLKKYLLIVQQLERSKSQKQLDVFQNSNNFLPNWKHHEQRKTAMHYTSNPLVDAFHMLQRDRSRVHLWTPCSADSCHQHDLF